jgi:thiamine biosynthesis lipoprotein
MLESEAREVERKYYRYRADSIISIINSSAGENAVEVDTETAALLDYADLCFRQSAGLFDITSGVLRRAWNFKAPTLPLPQYLTELLPLIGWTKVEWRKPFVRLPLGGMEIDFGGLGKEYASDRLATRALALGVTSAMINLSGDIRILGPHPDGSSWQIGITHPRDTTQSVTALSVAQGAVATSGDYERYIEVGGTRYCHILNPKTGSSVCSFQSVTVHAESCLVAGSATTIAMLFGVSAGMRFLKELGLPFVTVDGNGVMTRQIDSK